MVMVPASVKKQIFCSLTGYYNIVGHWRSNNDIFLFMPTFIVNPSFLDLLFLMVKPETFSLLFLLFQEVKTHSTKSGSITVPWINGSRLRL